MFSFTEKKEFKDFSRPLGDFPVLFKAILIFKDFQESPLNSSIFQACANPVVMFHAVVVVRKHFSKYYFKNIIRVASSGSTFCWS